MADLTNLQAAETIRIAGANSSGVETAFVNSTINGDLQTADIINTAASQLSINVTTSAVIANISGDSNLSNRKLLIVQCQTGNMTYGFTIESQPFTLPNGATLTLALGPNISVYLRRTSGSGTVVVAELA